MNMTEICRKIYSSILAWRIPWTEEPGEEHMTEQLTLSLLSLVEIGS